MTGEISVKFYPCGSVRLSKDRCTGCGDCVKLCPVNALKLEDGTVVQVGVCVVCLGCMAVCKERAIQVDVVECPEELEVDVTSKNNVNV
ncbi:hypothetical protein Pyrfu_0907 [Pyrolobus fumarii 1A]|uniref:4Fe-4S ferredoxin-type domain-containing protein n=1 Tax=Pyrolobus fumarii (strain DSM 11204 / 1A) TaxID=694429 RepID=G0EE82_PYRF1|nr:4Fe-4S binding protein [Pyrolobus fumarii]AEM38776.1 hypothetical protein Pyrfu_0907 [Pyrolobus fumarii 1A]